MEGAYLSIFYFAWGCWHKTDCYPIPSTSCPVSGVKYINYNHINSLNSYDLPDYQHNMNPAIHLIQSYNYKTLLEKNFTEMIAPSILPRQSASNPMQNRRSTNLRPPFSYPVRSKNLVLCYRKRFKSVEFVQKNSNILFYNYI